MAADPLENDELLLLKKRARRRLVGAIAFMMVALVVLSAVMESRPLPQDEPVKVAIDGLASAPTVPDSDAFAAPAGSSASEAAASVVSARASLPLSTRGKDTRPAPGEDIDPAASAPARIAPSRPAKTTAAATDRKDAAKSAPKDARNDKSRAKPPVDQAREVPQSGLSASVIALSDAGRASELQRKIRAQGLHAYTEQVKVGDKTLTRVRIGPYATRAELDKARAKLALMGL